MAKRSWLLTAGVALVGLPAAFAFPSDGSAYETSYPVALTAAGPSPSTLTIRAGAYMDFVNRDSVTHTVVFANGRCTVSVPPGYALGPGNDVVLPGQQPVPLPDCHDDFPFYVGSYAYTVDGRFAGTVETAPLHRSVTLTARAHRIRRGVRLTLHGRVSWSPLGPGSRAPFPVVVLARTDGKHPFEPIATVPVTAQGWRLSVRPGVTTTYVAEANGQLPEGQVWTPATSRAFTLRVRR
ncbi:MAG TPA: hypothetical protein VJ814_01230 [Gaiellaceae bacterium]|nr:hypothetical protein [Gaiellaceae bacterium]